MPETLFQKIWKRHVVASTEEATLLYIDRHLIHEVTSPRLLKDCDSRAGVFVAPI